MNATSAAASGYMYTAATTASTLSSSTTHLNWGSKGWTFLLSVHESSWELFPLCFNSLLHSTLIVYCSGILLARWSSGMLTILLGFEIGSSLGFTLIFVWMLTWESGQSLSSPADIGLTGSCSEFLDWKCWNIGQVGLMVVWCHFVDARTALLLIMLKYRPICTVSYANTFKNILSTISELLDSLTLKETNHDFIRP